MSRPEAPQDLAKRVTEATLKALSGDGEATVSFGHGPAVLTGSAARLPLPSAQLPPEDMIRLRGSCDSAAMRLRHHDEGVHRRRAPAGGEAREVFNVIEQARCDALGADRYAGVAENLACLLEDQCHTRGYGKVTRREAPMMADAVGLLVRERLFARPLPTDATALMDVWRQWLNERIGDSVNRLVDAVDDQDAFARRASDLIRALDLMGESDGQDDDDEQDPEEDGDSDEDAGDGQSAPSEDSGQLSADGGAGDLDREGEGAASGEDEALMTGAGDEEPAGLRAGRPTGATPSTRTSPPITPTPAPSTRRSAPTPCATRRS